MSWLVQKQFNIVMGMTVPGFYKDSKIYATYTIFVDICLMSFVVSYIGGAMLEEDTPKTIFSSSGAIFSMQILCVKLYTRLYEKKLLELVEEFTPQNGETLSPQYHLTPRILPYLMNIFVTLICVIYDVHPIIPILNPEGDKVLSIPAYFPFSLNDSPYFEFATLFLGLSGFYVCGNTAAFYDLYVNMGGRLIAKYYHLRKDLPRVINDKDNVYTNLKEWIKNHQHTSRMEKDFQDVFAPGLLILLSYEVIPMCMVIYVCTKVEMNFLNRVICFCFAFGFYFKLFIITRCGDHINYEGSRITEEGFGARWHELPLEAQSSLKIIFCRAKKHVNISAKGIFEVNTNTFRSFVMSSYSYYTFLAKLK